MFLIFSSATSAQSVLDAEKAQQQNDQLIQQFQQQQKAQKQQRERLQPNIQFGVNTRSKQPLTRESKNALCFKITYINIQGVRLLSEEKTQQLTLPYKQQCLTLNKINSLVKDITLSYVDLGYVTSRAYIPQQDLSTGDLRIIVVEGFIEAFDNSKAPTLNQTTAFPKLQGQPLNLRDIEQGIEQINRLAANNANMKLLPGQGIGATIIQLNNTLGQPWQSQISVDNSGQKTTGEYQSKLLLSRDNPFNLNDYLSLNIQNDAFNPSQSGDSSSVSLRYEIPYGYWLYSLDVNWYNYKNTIKGAVNDFESSGESQSQTLKAKYIWQRDQFKKTDVSIQLTRKTNKNYIEDALLDTSSRTLSVLTLSINQQRFYSGHQSFQWSLALKRGLPNFGAKESTQGDSQNLEYTALTAGINYSTPFTAAKHSFHYASQWSLQFSEDNLYGSEQFSIGSQYSVRGFKGDSLSSRTGMYWRHDVSYPMDIDSTLINSISPFFGVDFGAIKNTDLDKVQQLNGLTVGVKFNGKKLNAKIVLSQAQDRLSTFNGDKTQIYLSFSYSF